MSIHSTKSLLIFLICLPSIANSNTAHYSGCAGVMAGMDTQHACRPSPTEQIELNEVVISLYYNGRWQVDASYSLVNHGEETVIITGFPILPDRMGHEYSHEYTKVTGYKAHLDGQPVPATLFDVDHGDEVAQQAADEYGYEVVYLVPIAFSKGETHVLRHTYSHQFTGPSESVEPAELHYLLRTGGFWRNHQIGSLTITVDFGTDRPFSCLDSSLGGSFNARTNKVSINRENWSPATDLIIRYMSTSKFGELELLSDSVDIPAYIHEYSPTELFKNYNKLVSYNFLDLKDGDTPPLCMWDEDIGQKAVIFKGQADIKALDPILNYALYALKEEMTLRGYSEE